MAARRLLRLAEVAGGAYILYRGYQVLSHLTEPKHAELVGHSPQRPRLPPTGFLRDRYFQNAQGLWIFKRKWEPTGDPVGSVFLVHGYGEHCGRYEHVAKALTSKGFVVFALDHQGHGQSEGSRAHVLNFDHYIDDVLQYVADTREANPALEDLPRFLIGHSMGGAIAYLTSRRSEDVWTGVVFSGPAIKPDPAVATPAKRTAAKVLASWLPKLQMDKLGVDKVCSDPAVVQNYQADPLVYHGGMQVRWGLSIMRALDHISSDIPNYKLPFLVVHGEADVICDVSGSRDLMDRACSEDKQLITYPDLYHEIFNEATHERVLQDVCDWIISRMSATT